tara:strand:- start:231 stop:449 length:219 start_codon:yes stop_codon:yes gene_type:complete
MFFISTMATIVGLFVLVIHNAWLYEVTSEYPSIPMTKIEAKCMDIKSRLQEIKYRNIQREVQANYDQGQVYK